MLISNINWFALGARPRWRLVIPIVLLVQTVVTVILKLLVTYCTSLSRKHSKQWVTLATLLYVLECNRLLSHTDHWEVLQEYPAASSSDKTLSDVWSGSHLQRVSCKGRYFSSCDNLALVVSTDGVPLFKSSSTSLWPVYLVILNLPPGIRMNAENVLVAGLWYGKKPPMN